VPRGAVWLFLAAITLIGVSKGFAQNESGKISVPTKLVEVTGQVFDVQPAPGNTCGLSGACWWDVIVETGWNSEWNFMTLRKPPVKKGDFVKVTGRMGSGDSRFQTREEADAQLPRLVDCKIVIPANDPDARQASMRIREQVATPLPGYKLLSAPEKTAETIGYPNFYALAETNGLLAGRKYKMQAQLSYSDGHIFLRNPKYPEGPQMQLQAAPGFESQTSYRTFIANNEEFVPRTVVVLVGGNGTLEVQQVF
jgi:hypothetical protein